jgi:hypothetical protein
MKTIRAAGLAAVLASVTFAGPVLAQATDPAAPPPPPASDAGSAAPTGADLARARATEAMNETSDRRVEKRPDKRGPARRAHFNNNTRGNDHHVKIPEDQPTRACVDAITQMIDRLAATREARRDEGGRDYGRRSDRNNDDRTEDSDSHL